MEIIPSMLLANAVFSGLSSFHKDVFPKGWRLFLVLASALNVFVGFLKM